MEWNEWISEFRELAGKWDFPINELENFTSYRSMWLEGISPNDALNDELSYSDL